MTVFNAEQFLRSSINSILNQSYKNYEFIIIDDCSTDKSKKIINSFKSNKIKKFFLKKHIGRTPSLNFGLLKCKGDFIAILDADDISNKNRLLLQKKFLEKNKKRKIVGSNTILIDKNGKKIKNFYIPKNNLEKKMIFQNYLPHSTVMYKKNFLKKIGYFYPTNFKYSQDYALWLKFLLKTKIYIIPKILTKCRVLKNNMTNKKELKFIREIEKFKNYFFSLRNFNLNFQEKFFLIYSMLKTVIRLFYKVLV